MQNLRERVGLLHARVDARAEEGTLMIKTAKALLNNQLGLSDSDDIVQVVEEIDRFLIERRDK